MINAALPNTTFTVVYEMEKDFNESENTSEEVQSYFSENYLVALFTDALFSKSSNFFTSTIIDSTENIEAKMQDTKDYLQELSTALETNIYISYNRELIIIYPIRS